MKIYELLRSWFRAILGTVMVPKILKKFPSFLCNPKYYFIVQIFLLHSVTFIRLIHFTP